MGCGESISYQSIVQPMTHRQEMCCTTHGSWKIYNSSEHCTTHGPWTGRVLYNPCPMGYLFTMTHGLCNIVQHCIPHGSGNFVILYGPWDKEKKLLNRLNIYFISNTTYIRHICIEIRDFSSIVVTP